MRRTADVFLLLAGLAGLVTFTFETNPWQAGMAISFCACLFALVDLADHPPKRNLWIALATNDAQPGEQVELALDGYQRIALGPRIASPDTVRLDWDWSTKPPSTR